jgi:peptidoglycan L-alanyl-D-glutamate endopeptidase CwlK
LTAACAAAGISATITFTYRSPATQDALYAQGRTKPGRIVTNARAGSSFHNYGLAYDATPTALLKLPNWGDVPAHQKETDRIWALYGRLAREHGLRWGGDFKSIKDRPHCEWSGALGLAELRAGRRP